jgi:hypothetical protein
VSRSLRRAVRGLALTIKTPTDGWLVARMVAWRTVLPVLKYIMPLPRLVQFIDAAPAGGRRRFDREERIAQLAKLVFNGSRSDDECLELSLVTYRYLAMSGARPRLVIGIRKNGRPAGGHAWVTVDGAPVHDSPARLGEFESLLTFASGARQYASEVPDAGG